MTRSHKTPQVGFFSLMTKVEVTALQNLELKGEEGAGRLNELSTASKDFSGTLRGHGGMDKVSTCVEFLSRFSS